MNKTYLILSCLFAAPVIYSDEPPKTEQAVTPSFHYEAKDFSNLFGMPGFSDNALNLHFTLYKGYVTNINKILDILADYNAKNETKTPQYAELKRRQGWEFDGMRLHELYFENLGGHSAVDKNSALYQQIVKDFGSFDLWKNDFVSTGSMRGIGWSILYFDPLSQRLINTWINEHDVGHLAGGNPILIMDVFEHAYLPDYGLERAKYIDAFFNNINWSVVQERLSPKPKT